MSNILIHLINTQTGIGFWSFLIFILTFRFLVYLADVLVICYSLDAHIL